MLLKCWLNVTKWNWTNIVLCLWNASAKWKCVSVFPFKELFNFELIARINEKMDFLGITLISNPFALYGCVHCNYLNRINSNRIHPAAPLREFGITFPIGFTEYVCDYHLMQSKLNFNSLARVLFTNSYILPMRCVSCRPGKRICPIE